MSDVDVDCCAGDARDARCVETTTQRGDSAENRISGASAAVLASGCERCGEPKERTLGHVRYCLDCAGAVYREKGRERQRKGGSREQFDRMMAAWRDGTIARVLEHVQP